MPTMREDAQGNFLQKTLIDDDTEVEDRFLAGYKCGGKLFLAGVDGRDMTLYQRKG